MSALFSRILVAVDQSEPGQTGVRFAARLARDHGGHLILVHAFDSVRLITQTDSYVDRSIITDLKLEGQAILKSAAELACGFDVEAEQQLEQGHAVDVILTVAKTSATTLIVMGTHGRRGIGRWVGGSTTEGVLRTSAIPVLTVRPETYGRDERRCFERVFVGVDDSEPSDAAVHTVLELPPEDRQHVTFCGIVDVESIRSAPTRYFVQLRDDLFEQADAIVDKAVASARMFGIEAEKRIVEGTIDDALISVAKDDRAELIVLGSHGRRGIRRFLLGSVAESVVQSAPVPVLVVRTPSAPE